jgi:DNA-binding LacI/PurR family transcriptional regulator
MGFDVPGDVSIVGWDDSLISQVVHPPLTAITRDLVEFGRAAARLLLASVDGTGAADVETPRGELTPRGSTGRARSAV